MAQTIAARDAVSIQVQQTVAAQGRGQPTVDVVALQVEQTVAANLAVQGAGQPEPEVAVPVAGIQPVQVVADVNLAVGTPQLRVNVTSVNVRNGPGTNYRVISTLLKDSVVTVVAKNQDGSWFLIVLPGDSRGWIADSVTDPVVAADMVDVLVTATIPPPPAPTATATATSTPIRTNTPTPTGTPGATTASATNTPVATNPPTPTNAPTPAPIPSTITVVNNTAIEICFLFIDLSSGPWTVDRLGANILSPGFQINFDFPAGEYDFMAQDCSSTVIADMFNAFVSGSFTWDIR